MSDQVPAETTDTEVADLLQQQFYTAAQAMGTTGSPSLDVLLAKGLMGKKMPHELRGKRAADAFQQAFDLIGGIPRLALWADKNEAAFFGLYSKLIPATVKADVHARIVVDAPWMNPNRLSYMNQRTVDMAEDAIPKLSGPAANDSTQGAQPEGPEGK